MLRHGHVCKKLHGTLGGHPWQEALNSEGGVRLRRLGSMLACLEEASPNTVSRSSHQSFRLCKQRA